MPTRKSTFFYGALIAVASLAVGMVIASRMDLAPASFAGTLAAVPEANSAPLTGPIDASTFRTMAQQANPTVVSIRTGAMRPAQEVGDLFGFPSPFGGRRGSGAPQDVPVQGEGSGFIIDKDGYILTNNHVVEEADTIEVKLAGMDELEQWLPARLVGRDPLTDSALIQITKLPDEPLAVSKFGDSSQLAQGDWVMAIGNPFTLANTVTVGVVSAVGRLQQTAADLRFEEFIQTDAAINRGNSGGPLLNIRGEVIGINTMIVSDQGGGNVGVGFAVPINTVRDILPKLRAGKVVRGRIGVQVSRIPMTQADAEDLGLPRPGGALISTVDEGPAKDAGIQIGDVIVDYNGKPVKDSSDLVGMVTATTPGTTVPVKVIRNKKPVSLNIKIGELDLEQEQAAVAQRAAPQGPNRPEPKETDFGMNIQGIRPSDARDLNLPSGTGGAVVTAVDPLGPAARAGISRGDVIVSVNNQPVKTVDEASAALNAVASGRTAYIVIFRNGQQTLVQVRKR
jgi:serine protease Do